uniref:Uncharacterized protein n=1 Tax=Arundo donax TaxID=35708 RepID=A0A0A8Y9J4_ARUDO
MHQIQYRSKEPQAITQMQITRHFKNLHSIGAHRFSNPAMSSLSFSLCRLTEKDFFPL